jgi:two-component system NtrC family sensor kinase
MSEYHSYQNRIENVVNLEQLLSQIIIKTNDIFEAEAGSVALLESNEREIVIQAAIGRGAETVRGLRLPISQGVIGWVVARQKAALIPDVSRDSRFFAGVDQQSGFQTRSIMCAPMQVNGHIIGAIELMNMRPDYINEDGLKILSSLADQAALAIENARLLVETRQRAEEQVLLFESMAMITSDLALETVLEAVSRQMVEALRSELCIISRWRQDDADLHTMQAYAKPGVPLPQTTTRSIKDILLPRSVLEVQATTILETNTSGVPPQELRWINDLQMQVLLLVPLIYRRQTIGLVEIGYQDVNKNISRHELLLAETMTAQAAVTIEHARLYDETIHRLAEARVLQEVMVAAASSLDFDQVLTGAIDALHRTLGIERLAVVLPTGDGHLVAHPHTIGFDLPENAQIKMAGTAAGWVFANRKPLLLADVTEAEHYFELVPNTRAQLCVPVILQNDVVAVLSAESSRINAFNQDDVRLFSAIAAELTIALEHARLFTETRTAEANYRDLFDNANDFIFILNRDFTIESVNKMTLKTIGYEANEIIGAHITQFARPDHLPRLYKLLKERLRSPETPAVFELAVRSKDGREILLEITLRIRRQKGNPVDLHCIARDITQRRELERQLRQTERLSTTGKLIAGVAHELNNPLTSIIGYATMLQQSNLPESYREDLDVIFRQAQRARVIVRDLLTFARKFDLETVPVDINQIITASVSLMKPQLQNHTINVDTFLAPAMPQTMADVHQLEQVFVNLFINAIQILDDIDPPRQITLTSQRAHNTIRVTFADNGPGIPEHVINHIFDPFFTTKEVGQGTGLGLSICYGIISEHNGHIRAKNGIEGGAVFEIELPIAKPVAQPAPASIDSPPEILSPVSLHLLVVDDEKSIVSLLERVLVMAGHTVDTAADGKFAWQKLQTNTYDLVICDILMPDMAGPELFEKAIKDRPDWQKRFIFITGNVVDMDTRIFLEKSGVSWLSKPFLPSDIETVINKLVATLQPPA